MSSSCGSTNNAAFVKLCAVFEELSTGSDILEFEVLPKALQGTGDDILRDGRCIGVPKPLLVQAFLTARDVVLGHDIEADFRSNFRSIDVAIMLLFDPEYLIAANARKRRLQHLRQLDGIEHFEEVLQSEFRLLDSFCTSPLKRHTKSPTLWSHRRWLVSTYREHLYDTRNKKQSSAFIEHEMHVVMKAGDRHPKNYYAWDYARKLLELAMRSGSLADQLEDPRVFARAVYTWCARHPSDISGWMFLLFMLRVMAIPVISRSTINSTMDITAKLGLSGEAMWTFLRGAMRYDLGLSGEVAQGLQTKMLAIAQTLCINMSQDWP